MKENFQNAYDSIMRLYNNAKEAANSFPEGNELRCTWHEKALCYSFSAMALFTACASSGIFLETEKPVKESNLHPVFENILDNIKAAS